MPRPRFEKLPSTRQSAILDAALKAFAAHGFEGASYNRIIAQAGVSKGAMYYYFDDKEDLFCTVVRREVARLVPMLEDLPQAETCEQFWTGVSEWLLRLQKRMIAHPLTLGLFRHVLHMRARGARHSVLDEVQALSEKWTRELLDRGQQVGAIRDDLPPELLTAIVQAVDDAGDLYLVPRMATLTEEEMAEWSRIFVDLLRRILSPNITYHEKGTLASCNEPPQ